VTVTRRGETLELAVLGLLHESPLHGYELRKRVNTVLGWGRVLSYGTLYPALKKLLRAGYIAEVVAPAAPAASRRQRITYALTPLGQDRFAALMAEAGPSAWEDDNFDVRFAFFSRTDMEIRLRILEGRRSRLQERLSRVQAQLDRTQQQVDRYAVELQRHGVESVEREVRWLSSLIDAERDGAHGASEREPQDAAAHPDESAAFPAVDQSIRTTQPAPTAAEPN
jgi:DNA-binding PadR family transcriptional regulator